MQGTSKGLEGGLKGASRGFHLRKALKGLEGTWLQGGLKPSALKGNLKRV